MVRTNVMDVLHAVHIMRSFTLQVKTPSKDSWAVLPRGCPQEKVVVVGHRDRSGRVSIGKPMAQPDYLESEGSLSVAWG